MGTGNYQYKISSKAREAISRAILISGSARSGTTILGKLIHSAREIEYAYEPPMLFSLIPLICEMNTHSWKMLFETYCYEELLLGFIAGRNLNFNSTDDSYILNVKPKEIIDARLKTAFLKSQLEREVNRFILGIKIPDVVPFLPKMQEYYPEMRMVIIVRRANDVLNSIVKKHWYDNISADSPNLVWPYRIYKNCKIPYWAEIKDADWWCRASHAERAAYYYLRVMECMDDIKNKILVNYHKLVKQPELIIRNLFKELSLTYTDKTAEIASQTVPIQSERHDIVSTLPELMQKKILELEEKYLDYIET